MIRNRPARKSLCAGKVEAAGIEPARHAPRNPQYVYFVRGGGLVKIGLAEQPYKRLARLQTGSPVQLEILGFYPGDAKKERELHDRFFKARSHGEWFDPAKIAGLRLEIRRAEVFAQMSLEELDKRGLAA